MSVMLIAPGVVILILVALSIRVVNQYEKGVHFRLGRVIGVREPGLRLIIPALDRLPKVSLRIVTMPIQSQGIITKDNVSIDVSAVAYYRVEDPIRSVIAIENVEAAIGQIAQTTLRAVVGRHTLDDLLSETEGINRNIREILDVQTEEWGVKVTVVELRDIQLPDSMQRAMARQAEAEREKRAKIIAAEGEALAAGALAQAADVMAAHPLAPGASAPRPVGATPARSGPRSRGAARARGVVLPIRHSRPGDAGAGHATEAPRGDGSLSVRPEPDVRGRALDRRRPGPVLREPAGPGLCRALLGHGPSLGAGVRRAQLERPLRRGLRGLLRGRAPVVAAPASMARVTRLYRSIKLRKSGTDGVGSLDSAFSTANSAMRSTAQGKWASLRLR